MRISIVLEYCNAGGWGTDLLLKNVCSLVCSLVYSTIHLQNPQQIDEQLHLTCSRALAGDINYPFAVRHSKVLPIDNPFDFMFW